MIRKLSAIAAALALAAAFGCNKGGEGGGTETTPGTTGAKTGGDSGKKLRIAMIPKGTTHEFWKSVHAGAKDAEAELGNVEVIWKGPVKEDDREEQVKVVEDFTNQKVDAIALAPLDDTALKPPVEAAQKAGIPVIIFDSDLKDVETVSFVATDNKKGGFMAGEELARLLGGKGKVILLRYQEGSASTTFREAGFLEAMAKNPGIKIVSQNRYAGATPESAQTESENLLNPLKKSDGGIDVDGIFCPNESSTVGMLLVLKANGWAGKVKFIGFDASQKLVDALSAGDINGLILQNPRKMGIMTIKTIVDKINGKPVEKRIDTGATLVTKANMAQPEVAKLLETPKE